MLTDELSISQAHAGLVKKEFSSLELAEAALDVIAKKNPEINACITVTAELAREQSAAVDKKIAAGESIGALEGVPYNLKDVFMTRGIRTTAASKVLENYIPPFDTTVYQKLKAAGGVLVAKTNTDEFTMGASNETSAFGPVKNPHDQERVSGGSSGGPAASTAVGMGLYSIATDTGGSIRQPASFCGVVGFKPTYGVISRYGDIPMASSLDTLGPIAKTVEDVATVLQAIQGSDPKDATCANRPVPDYAKAVQQDIKGLRVGVPKEFFVEGMEPGVEKAIRAAIESMAKAGAEIVEVSMPHTKYALPTYYIIAPAEVSSNMARYDGVRFGHATKEAIEDYVQYYMKTRDESIGDEVKRRIMIGTYVLSAGSYDAYYRQAQKVRTLVCGDFEEVFKKVDVLVGATSPTVAFRLGEKSSDPLAMYLADILTVSANIAGTPAISVPCGTALPPDGKIPMPVGLQIIGPQYGEEVVLRAAAGYERIGK